MGIAFLVLAMGYGLICLSMFARQRQLMYLPGKQIDPPDIYGLSGFSDLDIGAAPQVLQAWWRPPSPGYPIIAYFHGNAGTIAGRAGLLAALAEKGFGIAALSYRGYGRSTGTPTEQGLYADARSLIGYVTGKVGIPTERILIYGESLGTGVAVQMATEYKACGLVLQAPYTSIVRVAGEVYPWLPVRLLLRDRYDSLSKIGRITMPLLLYHGEKDETIPVHHGRALLEAAPQPKQGIFLPGNAHNDFDSAAISAHVLEFAQSNRLINA